MAMADRRIDIRHEFAACVRSLGGRVSDDQTPPPSFKCADYIFEEARVVAELKCLEEDLRAKDTFREATALLYRDWVKAGLVRLGAKNEKGVIPLTLGDLPRQCAEQIMNLLRKTLRTPLRSANKQIRETKRNLGLPNGKGLLLLANDGNSAFDPEMAHAQLARILLREFEHINSVVYFSVNEPVSSVSIREARFWVEYSIQGREAIDPSFILALRNAWVRHHSRLIEGAVAEIYPKDDTDFYALRFTKSD